MSKYYCRVAVNYPKNTGLLTYKCSDSQKLNLKKGTLVEIPFGKRFAKGCIIENGITKDQLTAAELKFEIKDIKNLINEEFSLTEDQLKLYQWISKYYHYSLGKIIFDTLPKVLKRPRKVEFLLGSGNEDQAKIILNEEQRFIVEKISTKLNYFDQYYIHGVTGSGKTVCYLELMNSILTMGKSVLFLLPEINLTPQFTLTLKETFKCNIFSYHSAISGSEKYLLWKTLRTLEEPSIVIGVRSSVFLPINNLGLIIIDEEHDNSFKQTDRCPYNARDVAIKKSQIQNCPVILGSATPMTEQFFNFKINKHENYFQLKKRALGQFPKIEIIDESGHQGKNKKNWPLEEKCIEIIKDALQKNEQILVFINRLGFAQFVQCSNCGYQFTDPNTDVNLRYFKKKNTLESNYSDYKIPMPQCCPECDNLKILSKGYGTEKIHQVLSKIFSNNKIERFDRDEIKNFTQLEDTLSRFHNGQIDILVGTQMLSKGHNFKRVNTVLILGVDSLLNLPDFRSCERVYQTIMQVAGRAGRYSKSAKVFIQSKMPAHPLFDIVKKNKLELFYNECELAARKMANLPPFSKIACLYCSHKSKEKLVKEINNISDEFYKFIEIKKLEVDLLGPTPLMIEKRSGQFTWALLIRSVRFQDIHFLLNVFENTYKLSHNVNVKIDVDPYYTL